MQKRTLICVVDDDESVRESLPELLRAFGFAVEAFASARAFLASVAMAEADCLILDIAMPEMSGPELQSELIRRGRSVPIIFITAHSQPDGKARVLAQGAVACLYKPFSQAELLAALAAAIPGSRSADDTIVQ
jgi:FixJ family two-component response regulator